MKKYAFIVIALFHFFFPVEVKGQETIDIAAIYALTGAAAEANAFSLVGIRYAVDEINSQGGIFGKKVRLVVFDHQSTPIGATIAARKAADAQVAAILGSDWSSHSLAIARVAQEKEIPMITSYSTNPKVTRTGDYIFRVCFTDDFQGEIIAKFARQDLHATTAVNFIDVTSDYSITLAEIFKKDFEKLGGQVLLELEYKQTEPVITHEIQAAIEANPDIIFIPGHDESGFIAKKLQDMGTTAILLGGDGWGTPAFFQKGGNDLKTAYYTTHWSDSVDTDVSRSFVKKYAMMPSSGQNIALAYDAAMLLFDAIVRAGKVDRKKIRDALTRTRDYKGVTGTISLNATGDPIKDAVLMEIKSGKPRFIKVLKP